MQSPTRPPTRRSDAAKDDAALFGAVVQGDRDAFRALFERHARIIHAYVTARIGASDADDVVVETFEVAWRRCAEFDRTTSSARPWLLGIATRLTKAHGTDGRRWRRGLDEVAPREHANAAESYDDSLDPTLVAAIAQLSDSERAVLVLVALGELSVAEAARTLEITPVTARVRLHRARRAVRAYLIEHEEGRS